MTFQVFVATLPWVAFLGFLLLGVRLPRPLLPPVRRVGDESPQPPVSVIVPARNEARNIERVLTSLAASDYPDFEVIVVDDGSEDGTGELARGVAPGNAHRIRVLAGAKVPAGWLGKPWACHQGASRADGDLLLFTDADTWHGPHLLRKAVAALQDEEIHLLSVAGRQLMWTFWEKLVQPQIFTGMVLRYRDQREVLPRDRWRSAIANGQFILVRREVYQSEGGHEAVRGEVVEDMRLAQRWVRRGRRVSIRMAEEDFATRMYASLRELIEGWSKNVVLGGLATLPPGWLRRWTPPLGMLAGGILWMLPPIVLAGAVSTPGVGWTDFWSALVVALSVLAWSLVYLRARVSPVYALLYPVGAAVFFWILLKAWMRGGRVRWKGRDYDLKPEAVLGEP